MSAAYPEPGEQPTLQQRRASRSSRPSSLNVKSTQQALAEQLHSVSAAVADSSDDDDDSFASVSEGMPSPLKPPRRTLLNSPRRFQDLALQSNDQQAQHGAATATARPPGPVPGVSDPSRRMSMHTSSDSSMSARSQSNSLQKPSTPQRARSGTIASGHAMGHGSPTPRGKTMLDVRRDSSPQPQSPTRSPFSNFAAPPRSPLRVTVDMDSTPSPIRSPVPSARAAGEGALPAQTLLSPSYRSQGNGMGAMDTTKPLSIRSKTDGKQTNDAPTPSIVTTGPQRQRSGSVWTLSSRQPLASRPRADSVQSGSGSSSSLGLHNLTMPGASMRPRAGSVSPAAQISPSLRARADSMAPSSPSSSRLTTLAETTPRLPSPWALGELRGGVGSSRSPFSGPLDISTTAAPAERDELQSLLAALRACDPINLAGKIELATQLLGLFVKSLAQEWIRTEFRDSGGFLVLVQMLSTLSETASLQDESIELQRREVLALTLAILHHCLVKHAANQRTFDRQIGWRDLQSVLLLTGLAQSSPRHFFGMLLGLALGKVAESVDELTESMDELYWGQDLHHAGVLLTVVRLLREGSIAEDVQCDVLSVIRVVVTCDKRNQCAAVDAKLSSTLLDLRWPPGSKQGQIAHAILARLYELGVPVYDGRRIIRRLDKQMNSSILKIFTDVAGPSAEPNHITFDMRRHGHSSMLMAMLRRPFPPPPASAGFTFFAAVRIDAMDPACAIDVLHIFDPQQHCFIRLSIDPNDGVIVYSTRRGTADVRFANEPLVTGQWYHLALSHARPRDATTRSRVRLHINGALIDEQITAWPETATNFAPIRAMFGSPPLEAGLQGALPTNNTIWSMGTAYLLDDVLSPDVPLVLSELALSGYSGNFQDSLGRFLTYATSTRINVVLDSITRQESHSTESIASNPLVYAITGPSRKIIREEKLILALNPANLSSLSRVMGPRSATQRRESIVRRDTIFDSRIEPAQEIVLNQAITLTRDAMDMSYGYAKLYGDPILSIPYPLADTIWRLGGCAILLRLVERADDSESLAFTTKLFLQLVSSSWRLSEDVEHNKGYEILNYLLAQKRHLLGMPVLELLSDAAGVTLSKKDTWQAAALTNPFLYRIMLLDFTLWQRASTEVQGAHLQQIDAFLRHSQLKRFNAKRVARMQIARKLLYSLEMQSSSLDDQLAAHYITTLRNVLVASFNDAAIRAVSSFLAAQLCKRAGKSNKARPPAPRKQHTLGLGAEASASALHTFASSGASVLAEAECSTGLRELALQILQMLAELVLDRPAFLLKLGSAINIKWLLVFFGPDSDPRAAHISIDILTTLLAHEPRYGDRLLRTGGVKVMERLLPRYWAAPGVIDLCWASLFGLHSRQLPRVSRHDVLAFLIAQLDAGDGNIVIARPMMLRLVLACLSEALHDISARRSLRESKHARPSETLDTPYSLSPEKGRDHFRQRSQSVNVDPRGSAAGLKMEAQIEMIRQSVALLEKLTQLSKTFRDLLFAPGNLRVFVGAITAHFGVNAAAVHDVDAMSTPDAAAAINKRLLDVLALAAVEGMTAAGSSKGVDAIIDAIPPHVDLATATTFRLAFYDCVTVAIKDIVVPGLGDVLEAESCQAIASFIEQSSGEMQSLVILDLVAALLGASAPKRFPAVAASLFTSLDRIILFRLAQDSAEVFDSIIKHAEVVFAQQNQDLAFYRCLLFNVLVVLHDNAPGATAQSRLACYNVLLLMTSTMPDLVESIIIEDKSLADLGNNADANNVADVLMGRDMALTPFLEEWQGFVKSNESLKAAIHLDRMSRIKLSLDKSDEKHKAILQTEARMISWQNTVLAAEEVRIAKFRTDAREMAHYTRRQWETALFPTLKSERAILGEKRLRMFELDPVEGPLRMRAKLKEVHEVDSQDVYKNGFEASEMARTTSVASTSESVTKDSGDGDFVDEVDKDITPVKETDSSLPIADDSAETHDDKYRRVIRSLEKGDVIEGVENSLRVVFIECRASLLIFGKRCFYIVDDYFQRPDGELCNLWEAPEEERDSIVMSTLGSSTDGQSGHGGSRKAMTLVSQLEGDAHQTRRWHWPELRLVTQKTFLHRKTAVEVSFHDGQTCLLVLATTDQADAVFHSFASRNPGAAQAFDSLLSNVRISSASAPGAASASSANGRGVGSGGGFAKLAGAVLGRSMGAITQRWIERKISNFDYLMCLNTAAGRTYQDITQYPIMPFVLRDYNSSSLDLDDPASFRDLSLPMGAQTDWRRKQFQERYVQLAEMQQVDADNTTPFHYGTHYSTAATVSGFLIRLQPFDKIVKALQGGSFDLADRLFSSIGQAYSSASAGSLGDVRELVPEAYYLPEFLVNANDFDFGTTQSGTRVGDVELPPWARGDPRLFIELHRQALESDYVSDHLNQWIDLIFGFKQRGEAAVEATNVFHELSYDDGLDLHSFESPMERQAALKTVHMFGVCPRQLFTAPHPQRQARAAVRPSLAVTPWLLVQSALPARTLKNYSVQFIYAADGNNRPFASPKDYLILPRLGLSISTGHLDNSVRFYAKDNLNSVKSAIEMVLPERVSCVVDASESGTRTLGGLSDLDSVDKAARILLGGLGGTVVACQVDVARRDIVFVHASRGHSDAIMCLDHSHAWSIAVSGSQDTTAIIWDSEGRYVKTLEHNGPVQAVRVCARNGVIATASGKMLHLWSINGDKIASVTTSATDPITCIAFDDEADIADTWGENGSHEGAVASLGLVLTGHRGRVIIWRCRAEANQASPQASWTLEPYHLLVHRQDEIFKDDMPSTPSKPLPLITAVRVSGNTIMTGDEQGKLYTWSLPGEAPFIDIASSSKPQLAGLCMQCSRKFGVFEKRIACASCGGTYCSSCALSLAGSPFGTQHRFCTSCRDILALQVGRWATMASRHSQSK